MDKNPLDAAELEALRAAIRDSGETAEDIAKRAGVKVRWLRFFAAGAIPEPGFTKIRRVQRAMNEAAKVAG